jgi:hypothetical protein
MDDLTPKFLPDELPSVPLGNDYADIREGVRAICKKYPG